ncbi:hypothetical protein [Jannaschia sp. R86511]|uniref:hypothetical protein n=1 Tax=Jannaschia sp. R86511 TaxID=3093853 RepID=UPI0036D32575
MVPLDQTNLRTNGTWTSPRSSSYYMGSAARTTARGASIHRTGTRTDAVWLLATTCPTCGKVEVLDDGVRVATIDLRTSTTRHRQLRSVPLGGARRSGTITISLGSAPVTVDGLALRSY